MGFAINLLAGLIVFNLFSECINRAPSLICMNPNYVKKIIFPLEALGSVAVGNAGFHALTSLTILILLKLLAMHYIPLTIVWLPLAWLLLVLLSMAGTWLLSATGVFIRDIGQLVSVALNMLIFLSPIFFPVSALQERWQPILKLNPLAVIIEQTRLVSVQGVNPEPLY